MKTLQEFSGGRQGVASFKLTNYILMEMFEDTSLPVGRHVFPTSVRTWPLRKTRITCPVRLASPLSNGANQSPRFGKTD